MTMMEKTPRPAALGGANRAVGIEGFADAFNPQISKAHEQHQGVSSVFRRVEILQPSGLSGTGTTDVEALTLRLYERALAMEGPRAFACPRSSAALHEGGHCLINALDVSIPTRAKIWWVVAAGRLQWTGMTYGIPPLRVDDETNPEIDLRHARLQIAGVSAEELFDPDFRAGSSLSEIATAMCIVGTAALKMQRDGETLWLETCGEVRRRLKAHEAVVREIADELMSKGSINRGRLRELLGTARRRWLGQRLDGITDPPCDPNTG
jgi:hypothetical protein